MCRASLIYYLDEYLLSCTFQVMACTWTDVFLLHIYSVLYYSHLFYRFGSGCTSHWESWPLLDCLLSATSVSSRLSGNHLDWGGDIESLLLMWIQTTGTLLRYYYTMPGHANFAIWFGNFGPIGPRAMYHIMYLAADTLCAHTVVYALF